MKSKSQHADLNVRSFLLLMLSLTANAAAICPVVENSIQLSISDMNVSQNHEGCLHGVPLSWNWASRPVLKPIDDLTGYATITQWGSIREPCDLNKANNTRVNIVSMQTYYWHKTLKKWLQLQYTNEVNGNVHKEDYSNGLSYNPNAILLSDNTTAVKVGSAANQLGYSYLFWSKKNPRVPINGSDLGGVFMTAVARLVVDDYSKPIDIENAKYLMCLGVDVRLPNSDTAKNLGISKCKWVRPEFRAFNMHNWNSTQLYANPPPLMSLECSSMYCPNSGPSQSPTPSPSPSPKPSPTPSPTPSPSPSPTPSPSPSPTPSPSPSPSPTPSPTPSPSPSPKPSPSPMPSPTPSPMPSPSPSLSNKPTRFAIIGDYGMNGNNNLGLRDVAIMIREWDSKDRLDAVLTVGDNNYPDGSQSTIEANVGQHYQYFMYPYKSYVFPPRYLGAPDKINRFFPSTGNHDWNTGTLSNYLDFYAGIRNTNGTPQYYYTKTFGYVSVFFLDSDTKQNNINGTSSTSKQAMWLKDQLSKSTSIWKLVIFHHPPYSSGSHGNTNYMQWPFHAWGADMVINGHDHDYERIVKSLNNCTHFPYIVDGLGGADIREFSSIPQQGSTVRYNSDFGAILLSANSTSLTLSFINRKGVVQDRMIMIRDSMNKCGFTFVSNTSTLSPSPSPVPSPAPSPSPSPSPVPSPTPSPSPSPSPIPSPTPSPSPSSNPVQNCTKVPNSIELAIEDMNENVPHEGCLHGVPSFWGWGSHANFKHISTMNLSIYGSMTPWGQIYEECSVNYANNTRVQIGGFSAYFWSKAQSKWIETRVTSNVTGSAFPENFQGNTIQENAVIMPDGTTAVKAGTAANQTGYNYHFWAAKQPRTLVNGSDIGGLFTTFVARLVVDDKNKPSDLSNAKYLMCVGIDMRSLNSNAPTDAGISKCKWVRPYWVSFNMHNWYSNQLFQNPPPLQDLCVSL